ncbi:LacI family DNA-binding transcriptional regulator [Nocardioides sp. TF02-7]|uniref:LacI family DNA-binding transcriptional regulator n=1 Tax=Nocardioides sp. TF02-7 TaxID=2917724 RepID=UPI001F06893F|nr:LacI family DNA-binding transcriptional regulator [Nocardioides sp. TF02-7]UMG93336.1 LacI family DNA-binding transcriptional regulator [Nocardioides sp. TF02-7]
MPSQGRRATLAQVAERAGVSTMTASYAFGRPERVSAASRERVLTAARELGYTGPDPSARSLRQGRAGALGVVLGEHLTYAFDDPQAAAFLAGIAEVCAAAGTAMTILPVVDSAEDVGRVAAAAVDGLVLWTTYDDSPVVRAALATGRPVVVHGGPAVDGATLVGIDDRAAARAVGRLVLAGAAHPAVLAFPTTAERAVVLTTGPDPDAATFPVTRARLLGYRDAAQDLGLEWSRVRVATCTTNSAVEAHAQAGRLLEEGPVDAVAAMSDQLALGVLGALADRGRAVPGDVAVSGWDDSPVAAER